MVSDFYIPVLSIATSYDRAVGYFTSAGLALATAGLDEFASRQGHMRLVASPVMDESDVRAIERGLKARESIVEHRLLQALVTTSSDNDALLQLAWLVAEERLDVRIAVPNRGPGLYHEKVGVLGDADGCRIAFSGSVNETVGGLVSNFESIDVFFSWDATAGRVNRKSENFSRLWANETPLLSVLELPVAVRERLIEIAVSHPRPARIVPARSARKFQAPQDFRPRDYQIGAVDAWIAAGGCGIWSMATGTGKTKSALLAAERYAASRPGLTVVITAPFIHLVDQWAEECQRWGLHTVRCYESVSTWRPLALNALDRLRARVEPVTCLVSTIDTASSTAFREVLSMAGPVLFIADEVHNLGASKSQGILLDHIGRLGLSATPERWNDEEGTEALLKYFHGVVFEFTIRDGIGAGVLCRYRYEPVLVRLVDEELDTYADVMQRVERLALSASGRRSEEFAQLIARRTTILNLAAGKLRAVREQLASAARDWALFYCASRTQLGAVVDLIHESGRSVRSFTAEEDRETRRRLLADFGQRRIAALVAMRALDEGVDVPETREAHILASTGNPREFIQRRGRVLRPAADKTSARIVDYIAIPETAGNWERQLVQREVRRVLDFARDASNADEARLAVLPVLDRFELLHLLGDA